MFAITLGRAVGRTAATVAHAGAVTVLATGRFGQDVVTGTQLGYVEHSERLATIREAARRARECPASQPLVAAPEPVVAAPAKRVRAHA